MSKEKYSLHKIDEQQYQLRIYGTLECGVIFNDKDVAEWVIDLLNRKHKELSKLYDENHLLEQKMESLIKKLNIQKDMIIRWCNDG